MALVRVSVANLAHTLSYGPGKDDVFLAILNPGALKKGTKRYQALGGAAQLTQLGVSTLEAAFGASQFEVDAKTGLTDARFVIEEGYLEPVFRRFELLSGTTHNFEHDVRLDIHDELCKEELVGIPPILTREEVGLVQLIYQKTVRQPPPRTGQGTSSRERTDIPTRRLFRLYKLVVPVSIAYKIVSSPAIRVLSDEELQTTCGGSCKGRSVGGFELADNLFF